MPISAVDAISPAFRHARQQLTQPFRASQWARLAFVGLLAGEVTSGGCSAPSNFQIPHTHGGDHFVGAGFPAIDPALFAGLIGLLLVIGLVLGILFLYLNSVMRFVLFDSILEKECRIRKGWNRRAGAGFQLFLWQLLFGLAMLAGLTILVGVPAAFALAMGWLRNPGEHVIPFVLGGIILFFALFVFFVVVMTVAVLTKDFVVPQMALERIGAFEAWRRLLILLKQEKGGYAIYIGMKILMALGAALVVGIVTAIVVLVILIPAGGLGIVAVLAGKAAGLGWNPYTITAAIVVGSVVVFSILYVVSMISVPVIVFFPAYSIYFFAARYRPLALALYGAPPAPPEAAALPPEPPPVLPLPPYPEPIG